MNTNPWICRHLSFPTTRLSGFLNGGNVLKLFAGYFLGVGCFPFTISRIHTAYIGEYPVPEMFGDEMVEAHLE